MQIIVGAVMTAMGLAIAGIWTRDIAVRDDIDLGRGILAARDADDGTLFWPHWVAEYGTAVVLVVSGIGVVADASWAPVLGGVASGALLYTSINSLGWALARRERYPYAVPMLVGAAIGLVSTAYLLTA